ncbi:hypothetical protein [Agromyces sp. M3QZ16-3]|uniref:hypothetical protein n=1 Tax=Agromyces sp. M3QZ16-3 TaxID=3447585 RepID=UPI003F69129E
MKAEPSPLNAAMLLGDDWQEGTAEIERWLRQAAKSRQDAEFLLEFLPARSTRVAPAGSLALALSALFVSVLALLASILREASAWLAPAAAIVALGLAAFAIAFLPIGMTASKRSHRDLVLLARVQVLILEDERVRARMGWIRRVQAPPEQLLSDSPEPARD